MKKIINVIKKFYNSVVEARRMEEAYYERTNCDAYHKVDINQFM